MAAASPPSKRSKMSSDFDSSLAGDNAADPSAIAGEPRRKYRRRKVAIFLAYLGFGYQGMQRNPGARTIEAELEDAFLRVDAIPSSDHGFPQRYEWARAARTDKGVSAVFQVVSGRFTVDPPGFVERLNAQLPEQIRVFGYKRVTPGFSAKKFCDRRRYVYLLPVFALDPSSHPVREAVEKSLGSENEITRCLECSERGRKVPWVMGRGGDRRNGGSGAVENEAFVVEGDAARNIGVDNEVVRGDVCDRVQDVKMENAQIENQVVSGDGDSVRANKVICDKVDGIKEVKTENTENVGVSNEANGLQEVKVENQVVSKEVVESSCGGEERNTDCEEKRSGDGNVVSAGDDKCDRKEEVESVIVSGDVVENSCAGENKSEQSQFCYGEEVRERFNRILKHYVGTHNFHNFTTRTKAGDPSAIRYIISFTANRVVNLNGIDFVRCEVVGQSFMLHQIRKMIGLAVAIMRNCAPESLMDVALRRDVNINVPTAPEVGLHLDECFFTSYNKKWKDSHEPLTVESFEEEAEKFRLKYILPHIAAMERKEGSFALFLHSLNSRNYPDFNFMEINGKNMEAPNDQTGNGEQLMDGNDMDASKTQMGDEVEQLDMAPTKTQVGDIGEQFLDGKGMDVPKTQTGVEEEQVVDKKGMDALEAKMGDEEEQLTDGKEMDAPKMGDGGEQLAEGR